MLVFIKENKLIEYKRIEKIELVFIKENKPIEYNRIEDDSVSFY